MATPTLETWLTCSKYFLLNIFSSPMPSLSPFLQNLESLAQALTVAANVLLPYSPDSPLCQEKLMEVCRALAAAIEQLCRDAQV